MNVNIYKSLLIGMVSLTLLLGNMAEAHTVPGVDEPYDPGNYYSKESISYPDSKPSVFALRELMQGSVYDYKRHLKSIDFGGDFEKWLATLVDENMKWILDMLGLGDKGQSVLAELGGLNQKDFGPLDWDGGNSLFVRDDSRWLRTVMDEGGRFSWLSKTYKEGVENTRLNQDDMEKRMELIETVLENSQEAGGNMEAMQSDTEMQGLMNNELERRSRMLANLGLVQSARDRLKLDEDRRAMVAEERVMTLRLRDRNNMTEQDRAVGVREGSGFRDF